MDAEEKTRTVKIGDEWINQQYTDYGKNEQAEAVAIEMSKDMMRFYAKTYLHLMTTNRLPLIALATPKLTRGINTSVKTKISLIAPSKK